MKRPTQADVANLANVSRATVSYVINKRSKGQIPVSEETIQRVWDAVEKLGYEPDARARSLRSGGSTKTIGILIPDVRNPHYWEMMEGFELEARRSGYHVMMYSSALSGERSITILKALAERRIDGIIVVGSYVTYSEEAGSILNRLIKQRLPIVLGNLEYETDCLHSDYHQATLELMEYLYDLGHRRISLLYGVEPDEKALDRLIPYQGFVKDRNLPSDKELIVRCGPTVADGYTAARTALQRLPRPSALVCVNDWLAVGALRAAAELSIRVPQDLSVAGYDAVRMGEYTVPSLTTVTWNTVKWSRQAVRMLIERLNNPESPFQKTTVPHKLLIRESTAAAPGDS